MMKQKQGEIIRLLYVCCGQSHGLVELFSRERDWEIKTSDVMTDSLSKALSEDPDFLLVDIESIGLDRIAELLSSIREKSGKAVAAVFGIFKHDPGAEHRCEILALGIDDFIFLPLCVAELRFKINIYLDKRELEQEGAWKKQTLDHARQLLEKFKSTLGKTRRAFSREKTLLHNSLKQISFMTGERDRLKAENLDLTDRLNRNTKGIEQILGNMIETMNESNKGHSRRVVDIAMFVGDRLGLNTIEKKALKQAALLHEVGLLFLPGSVFTKEKGALTEYEKDLFTRAPSTGAAFLNNCPGLERAAEIISHLNENADGSGKPKGLKRRYIPLPARILAGADLLDDLINGMTPGEKRSPLEKIPLEKIPLEKIPLALEQFSGTRLDPRIVNLLEHYVVTCMNAFSTKVREVGFHQLEPGMTMGAGIYAKMGTKLFSAGAVLTKESLAMLMKYNREYPLAETVFIKAE